MKKLISSVLSVGTMAMMLSGCATTGAAGSDAAASGSMTSSLVMVAVMFAMFWLLLVRPEKKRKQQAEQMRNSIEVGDKITTIGGMVGRVVHVSADKITFETGEDRVRIEIVKSAVSVNDGKGSKEGFDSEESLSN